MNTRYDAIVVGGGPSGATAATLLARAGWQVAVIEKSVFPRRKVCGEFISATTWPLLRALGVAEPLLAIAGPAVHRVGLYAGDVSVHAKLFTPASPAADCGRAIGREHLDTLLMQSAARAGAEIWQPWTLTRLGIDEGGYACTVNAGKAKQCRTLHAPLVIAAHGSWERGPMPTQALHQALRAGDLLGFKAHFRQVGMANDVMPLLVFPGGYGGMVHTDGGRVSLSCCIRRDQLELCRRRWPNLSAGAAVLAHVKSSCNAVAQALSSAALDGTWLAAGPLRTGFRSFGDGGLFTVGNATAEAHPIVAEGLSMAMQSAALLCSQLLTHCPRPDDSSLTAQLVAKAHAAYAQAWRLHFAQRLHLASFAARLFMKPVSARLAALTLQRLPWILSRAARWSGKVQSLRLDLGRVAVTRDLSSTVADHSQADHPFN